MFRNAISLKLKVGTYMDGPLHYRMEKTFIEYFLDSVSEKSTTCNLVSNGTNFVPPSRNTEQLLQIDVKYVFDPYYILIHTYISLKLIRITIVC